MFISEFYYNFTNCKLNLNMSLFKETTTNNRHEFHPSGKISFKLNQGVVVFSSEIIVGEVVVESPY